MFEAVDLIWGEEVYTIAPDKILGAIAIIEEHYTFQDLADANQKQKLSLVGLARAYGDVMRYAGAKITDEQVYVGMFSGNMSSNVRNSVNTLLAMMIPPSVIAAANQPGAGGAARGNLKSSKASIKRSSARGK
ncbi:MAG TPA: hypothetical protein VMT30_00085 [Candidatus Saccharimonadia bacterium]|jgi:hypothetical protein|nr:hypothetical protein [Candidatus Saccharimonadia bacterium]